ncbi:MAG: putative glycosyltransferase EpsH [Chloroflexi bacterium ADurb.Bin325]|nr:MAG: putative glycosyltransferase EpsH [Chloroflexi bacterium ADurb.Bin325]
MRVSVICTVLNEGESIRRLLDSLAGQTRPADEIVVVDGGSRDRTVAILEEYTARLPLRVLSAAGANISAGRNIAIRAATGDVIASVDAGVRIEPDWLAHLVAPFDPAGPARQAVAGFFLPDVTTPFEMAMGATVLPTLDEIDPATFLPSSRSVAFTKAAWEAAGGYPEWLDYCAAALVHFRPRGSLRAFFKQYYRYARGDGKADLWRKRHAIRYGAYLVGLPGLLMLAVRHHPLWLLALLGGAGAYCRTPYRRLAAYLPQMSPGQRLYAALLVPIIRGVGDIAKMLGYPVGWLWRIKNWSRREIHWR